MYSEVKTDAIIWARCDSCYQGSSSFCMNKRQAELYIYILYKLPLRVVVTCDNLQFYKTLVIQTKKGLQSIFCDLEYVVLASRWHYL